MFASIVLILCLLSVLWYLYSRISESYVNPSGKTILITGCDSGLGLLVSKHLLAQGFHIIACCLSETSEGAMHLKKLNESRMDENEDNRLVVLPLDVRSEESILGAKEAVCRLLARRNQIGLWALINNAGICIYGEFDWLTSEQIQSMINVNLIGTIRVTKHFLDLIIKAKGRLVNVSSVNGHTAYPGISVYCATKFALVGFTDSLRHEMNKFGVKVILISPGDFARHTNIMKAHQTNCEQMWSRMDSERQKLYRNYFHSYQQKVLDNYGLTSPARVEDTNLLKAFTNAVQAKSPKYSWICASGVCRAFFAIYSQLSTSVQHRLLDHIFVNVFGLDLNQFD